MASLATPLLVPHHSESLSRGRQGEPTTAMANTCYMPYASSHGNLHGVRPIASLPSITHAVTNHHGPCYHCPYMPCTSHDDRPRVMQHRLDPSLTTLSSPTAIAIVVTACHVTHHTATASRHSNRIYYICHRASQCRHATTAIPIVVTPLRPQHLSPITMTMSSSLTTAIIIVFMTAAISYERFCPAPTEWRPRWRGTLA